MIKGLMVQEKERGARGEGGPRFGSHRPAGVQQRIVHDLIAWQSATGGDACKPKSPCAVSPAHHSSFENLSAVSTTTIAPYQSLPARLSRFARHCGGSCRGCDL